MRTLHVLGWLAWAGCAAEPEPEASGEVIWQTGGGFCDGPCPHASLRRDGDALQLVRTTDQAMVEATGTWTEAGLSEYAEASAQAFPARDEHHPTCSPADGIDVQLVLVHEQTTWTTTYCVNEAPPALARADAMFDAIVAALTDGRAHAYVTID